MRVLASTFQNTNQPPSLSIWNFLRSRKGVYLLRILAAVIVLAIIWSYIVMLHIPVYWPGALLDYADIVWDRRPFGDRYPDFIVAGAQKGGTTAAVAQLQRHPDIWISPREIHFFDRQETTEEAVHRCVVRARPCHAWQKLTSLSLSLSPPGKQTSSANSRYVTFFSSHV